ncbi:hypothetical protein P9166_04875 [Lactococcus lactis]|nr:hypothetical protein P9166_04875 [Lactococcus lactis]
MKRRIVKLKIRNKIRYKIEFYSFGEWCRHSTEYYTLWGARKWLKALNKYDEEGKVIEVINQ